MLDEDKNLYDALAEWKGAEYERIQARRGSEWRLTLAIWGGFGALLLATAQSSKDCAPIAKLPWLFVATGSSILVAMHALFLKGIAKQHHQNRINALII